MSAKMAPPAFDCVMYRSGQKGAYRSVVAFLSKFRGWAQATNISTKVAQDGDCSLGWVCITDQDEQCNYSGYPPAHGPGSPAKSKALHRTAQTNLHYILLDSVLLEIILSNFKTFSIESYDNPDLAVDGEPCPLPSQQQDPRISRTHQHHNLL